MKVVVSEFISLDGVVQAPGGPEEDTSGGFRHGGWSGQFFDPEVMGRIIGEVAERSEALLQGRLTYQVSASAWPQRRGAPSPTGSMRRRSTSSPTRSQRRISSGVRQRSSADET
jgi:hypothetical protein